MWQGSGAGRASCLVEGKRGGDGGWVGRGLWGMCAKQLYVKTGRRVGNNVVRTGNVLCRYGEIVHGSGKENVSEGHEARTVWCARHEALHHGPVVALETDA